MISIFLARVLGVYLVVVTIAAIRQRDRLQKLIKQFAGSEALIFFSGAFALLVGLVLIFLHNVWVSDWRVLITLLAWLTVAKGMMRLFFPERAIEFAKRISSQTYVIINIVFCFIGAYLVYIGLAASF